MRPLEYRVVEIRKAPYLRVKMVDIAIHSATGRMSRTMLRQAMNRLDKHRRQAETGILGILDVNNLHRYREVA